MRKEFHLARYLNSIHFAFSIANDSDQTLIFILSRFISWLNLTLFHFTTASLSLLQNFLLPRERITNIWWQLTDIGVSINQPINQPIFQPINRSKMLVVFFLILVFVPCAAAPRAVTYSEKVMHFSFVCFVRNAINIAKKWKLLICREKERDSHTPRGRIRNKDAKRNEHRAERVRMIVLTRSQLRMRVWPYP